MNPQRREQLAGLLPDWTVLVEPSPEELVRHAADVRIAFGSQQRDLLFREASGLQWLQLAGAGADWLMRLGEPPRFVVTNASGVHAVPISEHLMAMLLALGRAMPLAYRAQSAGRWDRPETEQLFELEGATALVVGLGAIGTRFAQLAVAHGMRVLAVRRHPPTSTAATPVDADPEPWKVYGPEQLTELLPEADHLVLTVPLTRETHHLIDAAALRRLRRSAYVYNIGRGAVVEEPALVAALQEGRIAGAGLDVFEDEPLPPESPLWQLPNVIVTGHYSGLTPRYAERLWALFTDNLQRFLAGRELRNVVDVQLGY